jgi:putative ABC transport system substrate-binding protein
MKRREFITMGCGAAVGLPLAVRAQTTMPVIGDIGSGIADDQVHLVNATRQGLKEAGYVQGRNVSIVFRWAEGHYDRLPGFAAELTPRHVAVITAAGGSDPGRAAKAATPSNPIVFFTAADPVRAGLVSSLSRPEANLTGISMIGSALEAKRLELLHELLPQASVIGALINPNYPAARLQIQEIQEAALRLDSQLVIQNAGTDTEIDAAFVGFVGRK